MKEVFDYISNNAFLTTIIGVIVGAVFSMLGSIYISNKERKERRIEEKQREEKEYYKNKPELRVIKNSGIIVPDISVFISSYKVKFKDLKEEYDAIFPKEILNKKKYKYIDYELKNIGRTDINYLYICSAKQNNIMVVDYDDLISSVESKYVFPCPLYEEKILQNETVNIRIYYLEGDKISFLFSCAICLIIEDENNNYWEQSFFYEQNKLEQSRRIDYKEYKRNINTKYLDDYWRKQWKIWFINKKTR